MWCFHPNTDAKPVGRALFDNLATGGLAQQLCNITPAHPMVRPSAGGLTSPACWSNLWAGKLALHGMLICGELITSDAQLDYIAGFNWDYVRREAPSC